MLLLMRLIILNSHLFFTVAEKGKLIWSERWLITVVTLIIRTKWGKLLFFTLVVMES